MYYENDQWMADSIRNFRLPRYQELPNMGLYLEQVIKYVNSFLAPQGGMELTASMVSNYVKKGVIPSPVKKQYYAEHIAYLFFVYVAKQLVTIEDISLLMKMQRSSYTLPVAYDYFCEELENMIFFLFGVKDSLDTVGVTESEEKEMLYSLVVSFAHLVYMRARFEAIRIRREKEEVTEKETAPS